MLNLFSKSDVSSTAYVFAVPRPQVQQLAQILAKMAEEVPKKSIIDMLSHFQQLLYR